MRKSLSVNDPLHLSQGLALSIILLSSFSAPVMAEDSVLVQELKTLTNKAKQQNAADRWLQRALESLVAKYDNPWTRVLLEESFADGDYTQAPSWQLVSGRFRVDASLGLISRVRNTSTPVQTSEPTAPAGNNPAANNNDVASALLGALLQNALGGGASNSPAPASSTSSQPSHSRNTSTPAQVRLPLAISNAFAIETDFSLHGGANEIYELEYRLFQDRREQWGYRLQLSIDGQRSSIELLRVRRGRNEVVSSAALPEGMANGAVHTLGWRQTSAGLAQISLDTSLLFEVQDKAFRDGYKTVSFSNHSGDIALRRLDIKGSE